MECPNRANRESLNRSSQLETRYDTIRCTTGTEMGKEGTIHHKPREMECVWYYLLLRFTRAAKQYKQHRRRMSRRRMVKVRYYLLCIWLHRSSRGRNLELAHKNRANPNPTVISMQIRECCGEFIFLCWFTICSPQHNTQSECNLCH